jgi:hypothetical protein
MNDSQIRGYPILRWTQIGTTLSDAIDMSQNEGYPKIQQFQNLPGRDEELSDMSDVQSVHLPSLISPLELWVWRKMIDPFFRMVKQSMPLLFFRVL